MTGVVVPDFVTSTTVIGIWDVDEPDVTISTPLLPGTDVTEATSAVVPETTGVEMGVPSLVVIITAVTRLLELEGDKGEPDEGEPAGGMSDEAGPAEGLAGVASEETGPDEGGPAGGVLDETVPEEGLAGGTSDEGEAAGGGADEGATGKELETTGGLFDGA